MDAIKQTLREHLVGHDMPLTALETVAEGVFASIARARRDALRSDDFPLEDSVAVFHAAVLALWLEYGGDPERAPGFSLVAN